LRFGCRKYDCKDCSDAKSLQKAKKVFKRLTQAKVPWGVFVFTFPKQLHPFIDKKRLNRLRDAAWRILEMWLFRANDIDPQAAARAGFPKATFGAMEFTHPEGDERPGEWQPHFNFLVPMQAIPAIGFKPLRWAFEKKEFVHLTRLLRRLWRRVLSREFGALEGEVDIWYESRRKKAEKAHAAKYFPRTFPGWSHLKLRARSYGFLSGRLVSAKWLLWEEADPWPYRSDCCRICGKRLEDSGPCDAETARIISEQNRQAQEERRKTEVA